MNVTVRFFAGLVDTVGRRHLTLTLASGATVADLLTAIERDVTPAHDLRRMRVATAVNREYRPSSHLLREGDEIALIPPVSGGAPDGRVDGRITDEPLSLDRVVALVRDPGAGAIVTFSGVTREVPRLEYEAYAEMAVPLLTQILDEIAQEHEVIALAAEHRIGTVPLGEPSVVIAASSAHRAEAFAAARAAIDRIKERLPVWKVEIDADGEAVRVPGTPVEVPDD